VSTLMGVDRGRCLRQLLTLPPIGLSYLLEPREEYHQHGSWMHVSDD